MKNYIDRYIYAVIKKIPEHEREEVRQELRANIFDMLPENPSDEDIEIVLKKLGNPRRLAYNYQDQKRYAISPFFYSEYINTLKVVFIIVICVNMVLGIVDTVTSSGPKILEMISKSASNVFKDLTNAFAWITLAYWVVDFNFSKLKSNEWNINNLPELPNENSPKISRSKALTGLIVSAALSIIIIVILMKYTHYFVINGNNTYATEIFNKTIIHRFIPFFIGSAVFSAIVSLFKLYYEEWNYKLVILFTAYEVLSTTVVLLFINHPSLILSSVFETIARHKDLAIEQILYNFNILKIIISIIIVIILVVELVSRWKITIKGLKGQNRDKEKYFKKPYED